MKKLHHEHDEHDEKCEPKKKLTPTMVSYEKAKSNQKYFNVKPIILT